MTRTLADGTGCFISELLLLQVATEGSARGGAPR
jgi:hypothetical protein